MPAPEEPSDQEPFLAWRGDEEGEALLDGRLGLRGDLVAAHLVGLGGDADLLGGRLAIRGAAVSSAAEELADGAGGG